ncbi:LLM class flavin-dependent oxidoreductase [Flexivirga oryzae]|uniref:Alkanesulfonate monooxygenase SsuD/methylene tetrahydromethanopterin reductase-like flavin-dependent oxidoreductase (Luciferase family) n=1 Tax=Flexivirga oryzae TaxID=1794944 RepID=A0A839NDZ1_9MICO|nr:LLM class flavin-dependent oxidoreductase [Flexivirga oryzae]MBB2894184.1 alkanesulfonate monooxygenase SsuD/methylene tetrahydromethanopterin reductase-like flavin-dependent oxidoreductase (luciferase family) [Flexivirga oryzae]
MSDAPAIGICFDRTFPASAASDYARRAEAAGLEELWLIEDCFFTTAPPLAAAALASTTTLRVGLGILPAVVRTAALTAMEIATLASMAPGRLIGGIGHGVQPWMRQMGVRPASPVAALEEVLIAVQTLLNGETLDTTGEYVTAKNITLEHVPDPTPPVVAGVRGPKSLAIAGRSADGVLLDSPCTVDYVLRAKELCGRDVDSFDYRCFAVLCVLPDRREARRIVAPILAEMVGYGHAGLAALDFHDELRELTERHGADWADHAPEEWWSRIGAIGNVDDAMEYVGAMTEAGVRGISFFPADELEIAHAQVERAGTIARELRAGG